MTSSEVWLIAGPNGAGKTTLTQAKPVAGLLPGVRFLNPDDVARERLQAQGWHGFADAPPAAQRAALLAAAEDVANQVDRALSRREAVGVETVLSTNKYRAVVERVRATGGFVGLIYVGLATPELACRRVVCRVREGGHDVPPEKIHARWHRALANLPEFVRRVSVFWVFDNSDDDPDTAPLLAAHGTHGRVDYVAPNIPSYLHEALVARAP